MLLFRYPKRLCLQVMISKENFFFHCWNVTVGTQTHFGSAIASRESGSIHKRHDAKTNNVESKANISTLRHKSWLIPRSQETDSFNLLHCAARTLHTVERRNKTKTKKFFHTMISTTTCNRLSTLLKCQLQQDKTAQRVYGKKKKVPTLM